jgi:hypothetical protein
LRVDDVLESSQEGGLLMASSSRKKTTMAKLNREAAVRERRARKKAKKDARKHEPVSPPDPFSDTPEVIEDPMEMGSIDDPVTPASVE